MVNYNLTNLSNSDNLLQSAVAVNDVVGGLLFPLILALVFIVSFTTMKNFATKDALLSSSLLTLILAFPLWIAGLITEAVLLAYFVFFLVIVAIHQLT